MKKGVLAAAIMAACMAFAATAQAAAPGGPNCGVTELNIIAQRHLSLAHSENYVKEFEEANNVKVNITYLSENDRRSRARLDASTGAGSYHIYYIDEANIAEFVNSGWVLPLLDYYPEEYDYNDFLEGNRDVASIDGVPYFCPLEGAPDALFSRKDILDKLGLEPPETLEEFMAMLPKVHNPPEIYAATGRGQRGSGANVWRWTQFFRALGGEWLDADGKAAFNSEAGVKASEMYKELLSYGPPGAFTYSWSDDLEAFRSGNAVFMLDTMSWADWMEDAEKSQVAGRVIYAKQPAPIVSAGWGHGLAIAAPACKDDCTRSLAARYIAWVTSKEMEARRIKDGLPNTVFRKSSQSSQLFKDNMPPAVYEGMQINSPGMYVQIMRSPVWPQIGDELGIALEQYYTGEIKTAKEALDQAAEKADRILRRAARQ
ncbi:MAG: sugar ABC transporter substrate-binding protein [Planctomycetota bacterium]|nr:sugar ABC transporter substrate-binding protein [Planctomycetota bacterium]